MNHRYGLAIGLALILLVTGWGIGPASVHTASALITEDCLSYNPNALYVVQEGATWLLTDGSSRMKVFTTQADAELGLQVARLYTQHCFIGRSNGRADRARYIFEYWKSSSGQSGSLPTNDCIAYDRNTLTIANEGANGWVLSSSASRIQMFDNQADAQAGLDLLRGYDRTCYIGRGTANIMTYLYSDFSIGVVQVVPLQPIQPVLPIPVDPLIPLIPGVVLAGQDCLSYNPNVLYVENLGANGWRLTDGSSSMSLFDNEAEANVGLQVARAHTQHCFIGRDNTRADHDRYVWEYWQGDSGLGVAVPENDCLAHDPNALSAVDRGADGWLVMGSGVEAIKLFDTYNDAQAALNVMRNYNQHCYIGRTNTRPNRTAYITEYLRNSAPTPAPVPTPVVTGEDCLTYNPFALVISDQGAVGWVLTDGVSSMQLLDTQSDAQLAASAAIAHTQHCFIGRNNVRPDRYAYIFEYWKGDSGMGVEPPVSDCIAYNPFNLTIADGGANGWFVMDGASSLLMLDTMADASAAQAVLQTNNLLCFIGRSNARPDRSQYIHTYLRNAPTTPPTPVPPAPVLPACSSAPVPRMIVGQVGRVTFTTGEPVRVRTGPGTANPILVLLPEGTIFYVTGGPVCSDPYWWWSVQTSGGVSGWMAEGVVGNYFIEPFSP